MLTTAGHRELLEVIDIARSDRLNSTGVKASDHQSTTSRSRRHSGNTENSTDTVVGSSRALLQGRPDPRHRLDAHDTLDGQVRLVRQRSRKVVCAVLVVRYQGGGDHVLGPLFEEVRLGCETRRTMSDLPVSKHHIEGGWRQSGLKNARIESRATCRRSFDSSCTP